jgi:predicted transposase/invertase (TIGR01784 family)
MYAYDKFRESNMIELALQEDALAKIEKGIAEGEAKGRAEGKAEATLENARNLKKNGVPDEIIAKSLGLTLKQVEEL